MKKLLTLNGLSHYTHKITDTFLKKNGDSKDNTTTFTTASARSSLHSGEKHSILFGKIAKYLSDLKTVAFSGSYTDLSNQPKIPTVGNGTVTIKQSGTTKGTFSMNQSGNTSIELTDTNTIYPLATASANGLLSSSDKSKLDSIVSWNAITKGATWSRICRMAASNPFKSFRGILSLSATRPNVAYSAVFLISAGVNAITHVIQLQGGMTDFRYRVLAGLRADILFDIYDSAAEINPQSVQEWSCTFVPLDGISDGSIETYATFLDSSKIPDGFSVRMDKNTEPGSAIVSDSFVGNLKGHAESASQLTAPYAASTSIGGPATSLSYKHVTNTVISGSNLMVYYNDGTSVSHALPSSSDNGIDGSGQVTSAYSNSENYVYITLNRPLESDKTYLITNTNDDGSPIQYANHPDYFVIRYPSPYSATTTLSKTVRALNQIRKVYSFLMTYNSSGITIH